VKVVLVIHAPAHQITHVDAIKQTIVMIGKELFNIKGGEPCKHNKTYQVPICGQMGAM
tara:strand:+ start:195 stop:368 length:174 start_codon:yes stop_codon:yes gene_type:complete